MSTHKPTSRHQAPKLGQDQLSGNSAKSQDTLGPTALRLCRVKPPNEFTLLVARETLAIKMNYREGKWLWRWSGVGWGSEQSVQRL